MLGVLLLLAGVACGFPGRPGRFHGPVELVLLHTADTHSMLFPYRVAVGSSDARRGLGRVGEVRAAGGFARLATLLRVERGRARRVLHLDAGDLFQGSLAFERFGGEPEVRAFAALGVDAQVLGNHELDRGAPLVCERYGALARFPLLAANYVGDGVGCLAGVLEPFVVLDAGGLRVGVIGVANATSVALLRERPSELGVLARDAAGAVQGALDALRPLVDVVVVVTHLGLDADLELVRLTSGIDLVLGGHQHLTLDEPAWGLDCGGGGPARVRDAWGRERVCSPRRVPVVHSGAYTKTFGRVTLELDDDPEAPGSAADPLDGHELAALGLELVAVGDDTPAAPDVAELLEPFRAEPAEGLGRGAFARVPRPLERNGATGGDSPLGNLVAEVARGAAAADLALLGASSLRHDVLPGLLDLEGLVYAVPFEDPLVRAELPGSALERAFEHAARSAAARECRTQVHVAGALVRFRCPCEGQVCARAFIGETEVPCVSDRDCAAMGGACGANAGGSGRCFAPLDPRGAYRVATTAYVAAGGSGLFDALPETALQPVSDSLSQALADELGHGPPCADTSADALDAAPAACASGCAADALARFRAECEALGLGAACAPAVELCERARTLCRTLPCVDAARGAARDGRVRFEAP